MTEIEVHDDAWQTYVTHHTTKVGMEVGAGVDFLLGERFVIGIHGGTIVREGDRTPLNVGFSLGWAFGGKG